MGPDIPAVNLFVQVGPSPEEGEAKSSFFASTSLPPSGPLTS